MDLMFRVTMLIATIAVPTAITVYPEKYLISATTEAINVPRIKAKQNPKRAICLSPEREAGRDGLDEPDQVLWPEAELHYVELEGPSRCSGELRSPPEERELRKLTFYK